MIRAAALAIALAAPSAATAANELLRFDDPTGPGAAGLFGTDTVVEGDLCIIGAPNALAGTRPSGGRAHAFDLSTTPPTFLYTLQAPDAQNFAEFGFALATDGVTIAVGDYAYDGGEINSGQVYLFRASDGAYLRTITPPPGQVEAFAEFGRAVAVEGDNVLIGSWKSTLVNSVVSGAAQLFSVSTGALIQNYEPDDGNALLIGEDVALAGDVVLVGSRGDNTGGLNSGALYLFDRDSGDEIEKVFASDIFFIGSFTEALDVDGDRVAVGGNSRAYVLDISDPANPVEIVRIVEPDSQSSFGISVALRGDRLLVGLGLDDFDFSGSGGAYLYDIADPANPERIAVLTASDATAGDRLGFSLDMNDDVLVIPAYTCNTTGANDGAGYVFANAPDPFCPGDVNGDGETNTFDFAELADNFGDGPGATLGQGDLNGDGFVDIFDFAILAEDFGCDSR